ncbi:MucBP domain-containing protein [Levilactobacillus hammesii]|uniref:MucBP domain-containing protein n=1 Tax=Levilactobacillus hammesii DSM 16381 TaxID=1423753 RepID=A0A0R1USR2_9LACO|nr:MucBP domain-containing protein [Levilactobacillus hammesii]KRL96221.1 hypothetical protein FD28_GL001975 [Levilactobacillus hammesii DSM 16381]
MNAPKVRFKLYKAKTKWVVAGIAMGSLLAFSGTAQADQLPQNKSTNADRASEVQPGKADQQTVTLTQTPKPATEKTTTTATTAAAATKTPTTVPATDKSGTADADKTTPKVTTAVKPVTPATTKQTPVNQPAKDTTTQPVKPATSAAPVEKPVTAVKPTTTVSRPVAARAALMRTAVSLAVTTNQTNDNDQLVYDNAPIDEWMPNKQLQTILLRTLQGSSHSTWDNNFLDPSYGTTPGAKTWNAVADITKSDLLLLKSFSLQTQYSSYIDGKASYSIEGLQYATNLQSLDLLNVLDRTNHNQLAGYWHGDITDLSPIKGLTNLTFLQFSNNRVSDISALANMKKLTYLSAVNNEISDFSMLDARQFSSNGLNISGQDIMRAPVYLKKGQDTVLVSNLGLKLPQNYNAVVGHYAEPAWSAIDVDYWNWYTWNPFVLNAYRRGANGTAVGDDQVQFKIVKSQITPGPMTSTAVESGSGVGVHQQPYTYYLVAGYYDGAGDRITTYYVPYINNAETAAAVTVHYTNQAGAPIAPATVLDAGMVGQTYTTTPKTLTGYTLDQSKLPANATGTFGKDAIEVTYVYDQNDGAPVTATYVDTTGATVAEPTVLTGKYGDAYTTQAKSIQGYTLQKVQGQATGTFTDQPQQVIYIYTKAAIVTPPATHQVTVTVHYQTADGTKIAPDKVLTGSQGDTYTTAPVMVSGYQLTTTPANAQGTFGANDSAVTYIYTKVTSGGDGDQVVPEKPTKPVNPANPTKPKAPTKPAKPNRGQQADRIKGQQNAKRQAKPVTPVKTITAGRADRAVAQWPVKLTATKPATKRTLAKTQATTLPQTSEQTTSSWWGVVLLAVLSVGSWFGLKRKKD